MDKIDKKVHREGAAAASKAERKIKKAINNPIKPASKATHPGGRRPGDKKK